MLKNEKIDWSQEEKNKIENEIIPLLIGERFEEFKEKISLGHLDFLSSNKVGDKLSDLFYDFNADVCALKERNDLDFSGKDRGVIFKFLSFFIDQGFKICLLKIKELVIKEFHSSIFGSDINICDLLIQKNYFDYLDQDELEELTDLDLKAFDTLFKPNMGNNRYLTQKDYLDYLDQDEFGQQADPCIKPFNATYYDSCSSERMENFVDSIVIHFLRYLIKRGIPSSQEKIKEVFKKIFQSNQKNIITTVVHACLDDVLSDTEKVDNYKLSDRALLPTFALKDLMNVGDEGALTEMKNRIVYDIIEIVNTYIPKVSNIQDFISHFGSFFRANDVSDIIERVSQEKEIKWSGKVPNLLGKILRDQKYVRLQSLMDEVVRKDSRHDSALTALYNYDVPALLEKSFKTSDKTKDWEDSIKILNSISFSKIDTEAIEYIAKEFQKSVEEYDLDFFYLKIISKIKDESEDNLGVIAKNICEVISEEELTLLSKEIAKVDKLFDFIQDLVISFLESEATLIISKKSEENKV